MNKPNNCRICNSGSQHQKLRAEHVYGAEEKYNFWQCGQCELVYLWPVPSLEEEEKFYAEEFENFMLKRSANDRNWSGPEAHIKSNHDNVTRRWKFLKDYVKKGDSALEIGCSSGFMMDDLRDKGINVTGIEPSVGFSQYLRKRGHIHYSNIEELIKKEPEKRFDLIVHFFVLEHIRNIKVFLQQQLELLKPDGIIIAEVPCVNEPLTSLYNIPAFEKFYWQIAHHYYFKPKSLSVILDKLECKYVFVPEQRYDLSNHLIWMQEGKPRGQGVYNKIFSNDTIELYKNDLKEKWICDTFFLYIIKK